MSFIFPSSGDFKKQHSLLSLTDFFRCLFGLDLQVNTLTPITKKRKMRELILQGGDGSTFEEENRSGKTDIEVGDVFHSVT